MNITWGVLMEFWTHCPIPLMFGWGDDPDYGHWDSGWRSRVTQGGHWEGGFWRAVHGLQRGIFVYTNLR